MISEWRRAPLGASAPVLAESRDSACVQYAPQARARFNYKPGKTAVMAMCSSLVSDARDFGVSFVGTRPLLGILVDSSLTFAPFLEEVLRKGRAIFLEFSTPQNHVDTPFQWWQHRCL